MNPQNIVLDISSAIRYYKSADKKALLNFGMDKYQNEFSPNNFAITSNGGLKKALPIKTDHYCIVLCIQGSCLKTVGPHTFRVVPQSLHISSPKHFSSFEQASDDLLTYIIFFKKEFISSVFMKECIVDTLLELNPDQAPFYILPEKHYRAIKLLYEKMEQEYLDGQSLHIQIIQLMMVQLIYTINRACENILMNTSLHPVRQYQLVVQFRKLVEDHFLDKRTVQEYADLIHLSPKYLSDLVKQETGMNALNLINKRLYLEAQFLLSFSNYSVKEVADHLKFDTSSHFSRFFKHFGGLTPSEFKNKQ
ncbi:AraC family transcriptional regulator [Mucilaginibacter sp.]|uniref:AraC family transcriptional regulator n=1 Tax=Mucilaginibacter sp. TaxID=1882438 RepID=UPI0026397812|nr:AraC family transcriptional regulator [Mucilaginibacter sp.]MDB5031189.1 transcriptional regulator, AraC family [Mucilaginibacter sp.]